MDRPTFSTGTALRAALAFALSFVLAAGLAPVPAGAQPADGRQGGESAVDRSGEEGSRSGATEDGEGAGVESASEVVPGQALVLYRDASAAEGGASARSAEDGAASLRAAEDVSVVRTWDFSAVDRALASGVVARSVEEQAADGSSGVPQGADLRVALVERPGADAYALVEELSALPGVEAAQPNFVYRANGETAARTVSDFDDEFTGDFQRYLGDGDAGIDLDAALAARAETPAGERTVVAVIDTGVEGGHPDLAASMWENPGIEGLPGTAGSWGYDFADNDDDPSPEGDSHGTHVAGIIAAQADNGEGVAGVSADTDIMALKVVPDGSGYLGNDAICSAYQYLIGAVLAGENVVAVNNSWGGSAYNAVLDYLVNQAGRLGVISVFAAGNDDMDTSDAGSDSTVALASPYAVVVASTNEQNAYSTFSDYNRTDVDLAAPGSNVLSTVPFSDARVEFSPLLSRLAGKGLAYYHDFSDFAENPDAYEIELTLADGTPVADEIARSALAVEPAENVAAGQPGVRVVLDADALAGQPDTPWYNVRIAWKAENFLARTSRPLSDYAMNAYARPDVTAFPRLGRAYVVSTLKDADGSVLGSGQFVSTYDNSTSNGLDFTEAEPADGDLRLEVDVQFDQTDGGEKTGVYAAYVTAVGVGVVGGADAAEGESDFEPYAFYSGTSMAAPVVSGAIGQLSALRPDASALGLRGIIVGGTEPVSAGPEDETPKETATNGRFDWAVALDPQAVNASTWGLSADASTLTATVEGYGLGDASVTFDGEPANVLSRSDGSVVIAVPAAAFDGARHRVDVTDGSTGRTHAAAYVVPYVEDVGQGRLRYARALPNGAEGQASALVASESSLYVASTLDGRFLYATDRLEGGFWRELAAPGDAWEGEGIGLAHAPYAYAPIEGGLAAVAVNSLQDKATGAWGVHVRAAFYDAAADAWSAWEDVDSFESHGGEGMVQLNGPVLALGGDKGLYVLVMVQDGAGITVHQYWRDAEAASLEASLPTENDLPYAVLLGLASTPDGVRAFGLLEEELDDGSTVYRAGCSDMDWDTGAWGAAIPFPDAQPVSYEELARLAVSTKTIWEGTLLAAGSLVESGGDVVAFDLDTGERRDAGTLGASAVTSAVSFRGTACMLAQGAQGAGVYTLPYDAVERLQGIACPTALYADVDHDAWYHEPVDTVVTNGLMAGYAGTNLFGPGDALTRAQMAQVMWNAAGRPAADAAGAEAFADCSADAWYAQAVSWARGAGVFRGYADGASFGPDDVLSREQAAAVLMRFEEAFGEDASVRDDLSAFADAGSVSAWAQDSMSWAVVAGVIAGVELPDGTRELQPQREVTRAEIAAMMARAPSLFQPPEKADGTS